MIFGMIAFKKEFLFFSNFFLSFFLIKNSFYYKKGFLKFSFIIFYIEYLNLYLFFYHRKDKNCILHKLINYLLNYFNIK